MARVDYDQMAASYDRGRALSPEGLEGWRAALTVWLPPTGGLPVLDLGAGTGLFATAIASWFDVAVVAVEPSAGMRHQAQQARAHARVAWVGGQAERLPLRDGCCGGAWLSTVIHHLADLPGCARELRRVLRAGGPVLIRSSFPDRHQGISLFRFFPGAGRIADTFPTVEATVAAFEAAGFSFQALQQVPQVRAERAGGAGAGTAAGGLHPATAARRGVREGSCGPGAGGRETTPTPVVDHLDLLVLR